MASEINEENLFSDDDCVRVQEEKPILLRECQPCLKTHKQNIAELYCEECEEYNCRKCADRHNLYPATSKHRLSKLNEEHGPLLRYDMQGQDICRQHNKLIRFFCEDETKLCCSTCAIIDHRRCNKIVEIAKKSESEPPDFTDIEQMLFESNSKACAIVQHSADSKLKFTTDASGVTEQLEKMQKKINTMFEIFKQSVAEDIESFKQKSFDAFTCSESEGSDCIKKVTEAQEKIKNVSKCGSLSQQFIMEQQLRVFALDLENKTKEEYSKLRKVNLSFKFDNFLLLPPLEDTIPGSLTKEFVIANDPDNESEKHKVRLQNLVSIDLNKNDNEAEPVYTGLAFLPDGMIVAADNRNQKCIVYNKRLEKVGSLSFPYYPQDVLAVTDNELVITSDDGKKIDFIHVRESGEVVLKHTCDVNIKCTSIAMVDASSFLVGVTDDLQPIRIISRNGMEKNVKTIIPEKLYRLEQSACTYIRNSHKIVFTDRDDDKVYIHDIDDNNNVEITSEHIKQPRGVAIGPGDCIFVCSEDTDSLVQISLSGCILDTMQLDLKYPCSICISKDNKLLAVSNSCEDQKKLALFEICSA